MAANTVLPVYLVLLLKTCLVTRGMFSDSFSEEGIIGTEFCELTTMGVKVSAFMKTHFLERDDSKRFDVVNQCNELSFTDSPCALCLCSAKSSLSWLLQLFSVSKQPCLTSGTKNSMSSVMALSHLPAQPPELLFIPDQHNHFSQHKLYLYILQQLLSNCVRPSLI